MAGSMAPRSLPWHSLPPSPPFPHPGPSRDGFASPHAPHSHQHRDPQQPFSAPSAGIRTASPKPTMARSRSRPLSDAHRLRAVNAMNSHHADQPVPLNAPPDHPSQAASGRRNPLVSESGPMQSQPSKNDPGGFQSLPGDASSAGQDTSAAAGASAAGESQQAQDHGNRGLGLGGPDGVSADVAESRDAARAVHASAQRMSEQRQRDRLLQEDACALYGER